MIKTKYAAIFLVLAAAVTTTGTVSAAGNATSVPVQTATSGTIPMASGDTSANQAVMSEGEIKKVNKDTGKVTIKHGELANLAMPPMTMVFTVKETTMLDSVKPGDKVKFVAEKVNGTLMVTTLEAAK